MGCCTKQCTRRWGHMRITWYMNVGLMSLVHHVVKLVNMENVRWRDVVCLPSLPPAGKSVIVALYNYRHRTDCPVEQLLETVSGIGHLVEVIEVDIKD